MGEQKRKKLIKEKKNKASGEFFLVKVAIQYLTWKNGGINRNGYDISSIKRQTAG